MSSIRRQSIISSVIIYFGFAIGMLNMYLFTKEGGFREEEFGLYNAFIAIATLMMAVSNLAMPSYIYKFYPYYKDHLPDRKNDMLTVALVTGVTGFLAVLGAGVVFKNLVTRKYITHSQEIVSYYEWIFPLGFGLLIYTILEAYAWQHHKSVLTNFLKEVMWRVFTTVLIVLFIMGVINNFSVFIKLFAFSYPFIALLLFAYLFFTGRIHFTFKLSKVTRRLSGSIWKLCRFIYPGSLILTISLVFDSLVISSVLEDALSKLGVYSVAQNFASMIQAPQRAIIAASIAHLSRGWKEKNMALIQKIYQRSSINQLIFASGLFLLIILNFTDAVNTFKLKGTYLEAYYVVILLGLTKIVDMGTGVNAQIIGTSVHWRFEMVSGIILLAVMLPLSYLLTKSYGLTGTGVAQLISIGIYNTVRIVFLWKKFRIQPFTIQTLYTIIFGAACYAICHFVFRGMEGIAGMTARSLGFIILFAAGVIVFRLSPDTKPVVNSLLNRMGLKLK